METERPWRHGRLAPALYDFAVQHEALARLGGRLLWGADVRPMYDAFALPATLPPGSAVLDVPCGGGVAFRGLAAATGPRPDPALSARTGPAADEDRLRYVGADLSPVMLDRARAEARRRGLRIDFARVNVDRLPFRDGAFDLCVTYNGLHCFPDPAGAVAEMARVLRPGGVLRGSVIVTGTGVRQDLFVALLRRRGEFGNPGSARDLRAWLTAAGLENARVRLSGAFAEFTAGKPAPRKDGVRL